MKSISIDIETFSSVSLQKSGVYRYAESDDFEILLFGYSIDGGEVKVVDLAMGEKIPDDIIDALTDDEVIKWAFNAQFERVCLSRYLRDNGVSLGGYCLDPVSWHCTMVWAATLGLPLSLEGVGAVLGLEKQKLSEGKNLIKYFCVPCSPTKVNGGRTRNMPYHDLEKWSQFKAYNLRDVETEMGIQQRLANYPVPDEVWKEYEMDQRINDRGVCVDTAFVESALALDERSRLDLTAELSRLTKIQNPNSAAQIREWLRAHGQETESLSKKEVKEMLKQAPEGIREVLLLRQQLAKTSVKKYQAIENSVCADGRVRGMFQFYGAARSGRWAGRLVQLQNLPQNHLEALDAVRCIVHQPLVPGTSGSSGCGGAAPLGSVPVGS